MESWPTISALEVIKRIRPSPMKIRSATPADSEAVTELLQSITGVWQPDWRADSVQRSISAADGLAFVAVEQEHVLGFICGHDLGFRAYLSEFAVAESHQRAGLGTALLRSFEEALTQRGCRLVVADVYPPAEPFYRALGWRAPSAVLLSHRWPT
jgi:predicted N-acetyltransferase YhbS